MPKYNCPRCGYNTNDKSRYLNHLKRKNICDPIINNNNLIEEYRKYNISTSVNLGESSVNLCKSQNKSKESKNKSKESQKLSKESQKLSVKKQYECEYCNKEFNSRQNKWYHLKTCKEKKKDDEEKSNLLDLVNMLNQQLKEQRNEFKEELSKRDKQIDELIKKAGMTIGTQNIQQNIKILAYKDTDLSHLTDKDYLQCLSRSNMVIPNLIKRIHFNPKKPENHNIYISNIKNKYVMIYDGKKWNLQSREEAIDDMIDTNEMVIEQKLEEWLENGKEYPEIMKKFNRYIEKKEKDEVINKIKEEIKLILFNNRKSVETK